MVRLHMIRYLVPCHIYEFRLRFFRWRTKLTISLFVIVILVILFKPSDVHVNFETLSVTGFAHKGVSVDRIHCSRLYHHDHIRQQPSFEISDNVYETVQTLKGHPIVDHYFVNNSLRIPDLIDKTWLRMAHSSVWLEKLQVYLTVTRVVLYANGIRHYSVISFLRGQIHDRSWRELTNYTIVWNGNEITFPLFFNISAPYTFKGLFYGPEDPRIIVEQGNPDAEPVIAFNMQCDVKTHRRAMYIFRPFTNQLRMLTIRNAPRQLIEKNWMPFFYPQAHNQTLEPNGALHFIYNFDPLQVVNCELATGECVLVFGPRIVTAEKTMADDDFAGQMRGGTDFHLIPSVGRGLHAWVGFPRTHIYLGCRHGFYRPALAVLVATSRTTFHFDFISEPLDLGPRASLRSASSVCKDRRIVILNSIADWRFSLRGEDIMTLTMTVNDYTTEVVRLSGVYGFLKRLPVSTAVAQKGREWGQMSISGRERASQELLSCAVKSANMFALEQTFTTGWDDTILAEEVLFHDTSGSESHDIT